MHDTRNSKHVWYVFHPTLNSRDMLTNRAKPLTFIMKPHGHKTGNRKKAVYIYIYIYIYIYGGGVYTEWSKNHLRLWKYDTAKSRYRNVLNFECKVIKTVNSTWPVM